jgi:hypothetical protein
MSSCSHLAIDRSERGHQSQADGARDARRDGRARVSVHDRGGADGTARQERPRWEAEDESCAHKGKTDTWSKSLKLLRQVALNAEDGLEIEPYGSAARRCGYRQGTCA